MAWPSRVRRLPVPASCADLDLAVVERALAKHHANVHAAAVELGVPSHDLRKMTWSIPRLLDIALEEAECLIDVAQANLRRALQGENSHLRLAASIYVLSNHRLAAARGWVPRRAAVNDATSSTPVRTVIVSRWLGDMPGYQPEAPSIPEARALASPIDHADLDAPEDGRVV